MQQQRGRWPTPVACRIKGRALLYDLEELRAAAHGGSGDVRSRRRAGADADGLVNRGDTASFKPSRSGANRYQRQHRQTVAAALGAQLRHPVPQGSWFGRPRTGVQKVFRSKHFARSDTAHALLA
ncbi:hypothetical protein [Streptomyces diastaticus]|uniref:hypothetical protein n=1 Tax=Streptomyces diastaticus TaxID=1956 RepID=UPI003F4E01C4